MARERCEPGTRSMGFRPGVAGLAEVTARFLAKAEAIKAEAGVVHHRVITNGLHGWAFSEFGIIHAPEGRARKQLPMSAGTLLPAMAKRSRGMLRKWRQRNAPMRRSVGMACQCHDR
jgi:hypothetical protein